ncbi:MAG: dTDP-glucose 4,6-dehydratase [Clostridiales bacterium]|jgi:dTDP-glucose 4,6-dehydratase|nr:dTDP-glucose 4,6-dehydratase [Clostridiales bacterium]
MKKYLVTGGAGFIGSNFVKFLLRQTDAVVINFDKLTYAGNLDNLKDVQKHAKHIFIKGDICDKIAVDNVFKKFDIDIVVNFAAESHVDKSIVNPNIFAQTNILGTLNLLQSALQHWSLGDCVYKEGVRFLQVSTDEVYGALGDTGLFNESTPLDPKSPYSASKSSADLFVNAYFNTYKLPTNITRCSNNYGPNQYPEKLIPLIIKNLILGGQLPVYGDGLQIRDWLYVEDHCNAIDLIINNGTVGEVYNIGGNNECTNIDLVKTIVRYFKHNIDNRVGEHLIRFVKDRKGHDRRYGIDATKIRKTLGWAPKTTFKKGLEYTIQWYVENQDWLTNLNREV